MRVRLGIPRPLRPYCEGADSVELEGETVGALLRDLASRFPDVDLRLLDEDGRLQGHLVVIRNDEVLPREGVEAVRVEPGDALRLYTAASGG